MVHVQIVFVITGRSTLSIIDNYLTKSLNQNTPLVGESIVRKRYKKFWYSGSQ